MELDALQQRWQMQDARLDEMLTLNRRLLSALERGHTRTAMHGVARTLWTQFAIDALAVFGLGTFIGNRLTHLAAELRFLVPAIALFLPAIAIFASVIWQLVQLAGIDAAGPVTVMQRRLERLRARRVQFAKAIILTATMLWVPVYIVGLRALFGFDVYDWFPAWFLGLNVAIGAVMVPLLIALAKHFGPRLRRFPAVEHFHRNLAGGAFAEAMEQLARLEAFERDKEA